ncbi:alpha/beta hydrolase [Haloarcula sp. JP-L23]|uniref:alpha/beta hydrolase n=1 Tax=Haloarcula sp. JP-L23 TaxID=2716717 RepID=UPI00140EC265|nr:alpha/beta hydrolase [Haloarcula sp. JP-L23]
MVDSVDWQAYGDDPARTVVGDVSVSTPVYSPRLDNSRELFVYVPPSYETTERTYPVVYMHDGQNLFDETTSYAGEWGVDETMERLAASGVEAIVVGVPNQGDRRFAEYSPFRRTDSAGLDGTIPDDGVPGRADEYLAYLVETVKPVVDGRFRTTSSSSETALVGSSMGGLVSLYGCFEYPGTFGAAGVLSPAFWWVGADIFEYVTRADALPERVYVDVGGNERPDDPERSRAYVADAERMVALLRDCGVSTLRYREDPDARHHEAAWRRRLPDALRFLLC